MAGYYATVIADTPISYWRLGEPSGTTASDSVGTNTGTYTGSPTLNQTGLQTSDSNKAISLNGGYVSLSNATIGASVSYEMLFKRLSGTSSSNLFQFQYQLIRPDSAGFTWWYDVGTTSVTIPVSLALSTSYHLIITQTGTTLNVYLNGTQIVTNQTVGGSISTTVASSQIGAYNGTSNLDAIVDEVSIYNYVLTPTQALAHYNALSISVSSTLTGISTLTGVSSITF